MKRDTLKIPKSLPGVSEEALVIQTRVASRVAQHPVAEGEAEEVEPGRCCTIARYHLANKVKGSRTRPPISQATDKVLAIQLSGWRVQIHQS